MPGSRLRVGHLIQRAHVRDGVAAQITGHGVPVGKMTEGRQPDRTARKIAQSSTTRNSNAIPNEVTIDGTIKLAIAA